jgi:psp operon transcriptional activator
MRELERELVAAALERAKFNQRVAASLLGLSYHQLRGKIRKHSLDVRKPV